MYIIYLNIHIIIRRM